MIADTTSSDPLSNRGVHCQVQFSNLCLDKIKIGSPVLSAGTAVLESCPFIVDNLKRRRMFNQGRSRVFKHYCHLFAKSGQPGSIYASLERVEGSNTPTLAVEFNPQTVPQRSQLNLAIWLASQGVRLDVAWVERYDVALDYVGDRANLVLEIGGAFNLVPVINDEWETERYFPGKGNQVKLYDKTRERRKRGVSDYPAKMNRFEITWRPDETIRVVDLGSERWRRVWGTLRQLRADVYDVHCFENAMIPGCIRGLGLRGFLALAREFKSDREMQSIVCAMCGEVWPAPREIFNKQWGETIDRDLAAFFKGFHRPGIEVPGAA